MHDSGTQVVAVVSAMGDTTDDLIALARQVAAEPSDREMALLWSTGEVVSSALTAMALHDQGYGATALTGFQAGIVTSAFHTKAHILEIDTARIRRGWSGAIPIVAGFQGWTEDMDITVTGRGTSDTTAVALAVALQADRCEILKDVDGIFTADPRVVPRARKLDTISYEEIMELARAGSQVLHPGRPSWGGLRDADRGGVELPRGAGDYDRARRADATGGAPAGGAIAHETDVGRITIVGVPDRPGIAYAVFHPWKTRRSM